MKIKEVIVVEGIKDEIAIKRGIDAEVIYVSGFGITKETIELIKKAQEKCGVILFMDADSAGERIRNAIASQVKGVKHAYISKEKSCKNGDIGVEYALPEHIIESIKNAKCMIDYSRNEFNINDLIDNKLVDVKEASQRREALGSILGIGYANGKKFLSRLNYFNITREEFNNAIKKIENV